MNHASALFLLFFALLCSSFAPSPPLSPPLPPQGMEVRVVDPFIGCLKPRGHFLITRRLNIMGVALFGVIVTVLLYYITNEKPTDDWSTINIMSIVLSSGLALLMCVVNVIDMLTFHGRCCLPCCMLFGNFDAVNSAAPVAVPPPLPPPPTPTTSLLFQW